MHLIHQDNMDSEQKRLNIPRLYNLITDPKEEYNMSTDATWGLTGYVQKNCGV